MPAQAARWASWPARGPGARVTKGVRYHHVSGKQALFESVFERVEERAARGMDPTS